MRWRPTFRTKLTGGFAAILTATVCVAAVTVVEAERAAERATRAAHAEAEDLILTQRLRFRAERIVAEGQGFLLFGDRDLPSRLNDNWRLVQTTLEEMDQRISSPGGRAALRKLMQTAGAYRAIVNQAVAERGAGEDIKVSQRFEKALRAHREDLDASMNELWTEERRWLDEGLNAVGRSGRRTAAFILGTASLAILLGSLRPHYGPRPRTRDR